MRRNARKELETYRKREVFFQIVREKGANYVDSKSKMELCVELIESGIPARICKGRSLLIRNPLSTMISTSNKKLDCGMGYLSGELKTHLEGMFADGMGWDNHGKWHVDHIKPVSAFLKDGITDPAIINALDNLQPLWAHENLSKNAKWDGETK